jgi:hypothetical protein
MLERCKGRRRVECFWILIVGQFRVQFFQPIRGKGNMMVDLERRHQE